MKKFDVVWKARKGGVVSFYDVGVPAADAEGAIAVVRAVHSGMVQEIVSVVEYVAPHDRRPAMPIGNPCE